MNFPTLMTVSLLAASALCQDVRDLTVQTASAHHYSVSPTTIDSFLASSPGLRLVDIEVESVSPLKLTACYSGTNGPYATPYWWYRGITGAELASRLNTNQARLIDLEAYDDGSGNTRFACIMVPNTGSNNKAWWYLHGTQPTTVSTTMAANNARLVDFDSYTVGGQTKYLAVMIRNTGADHRPFWWFHNVPASTISSNTQQFDSRVYCLNRRSNGNFDVVLVDEPQTPKWTWWFNLDAAGVAQKLGNWGQRPINLESYFVNGQRRFAMATIGNCNELTYDVSEIMRGETDGAVGAYLRQVGGSELAGLNHHTVFEPASTIKVLHHVHAMRQVAQGSVFLNTPILVFTNYASPTSSCPIDTGPVMESLSDVLRLMMENSDNARTQAIRSFFGETAINNTALALNMANTQLRHRIGCGGEMINNHNDTTLFDLGQLHEEVIGGYLGQFRDEFYEHMLTGLWWAGLDNVIDQEGASLGMSSTAIASFKAQVALAQKGGSYTWNGVQWRSGFGQIQIPFLANGQLQRRDYVAGAFVDRASNGSAASSAVNQAIAAMLRPTLRDAMSTWDIVAAVATPVGSGCGADPAQIHELFPQGSFDLVSGSSSQDLLFNLAGGTLSATTLPGSTIAPPASAPLGLGDDQNSAPIPLGFSIAGLDADSISVSSNGYIWLGGQGPADFSETTLEFASEGARVAAYWTDLNPSAGGSIHVDVLPSLVRVTYLGVFPFGGSAPEVTAQVDIRPTSIRLRYGAGAGSFSDSVLVGLTNGVAPAALPTSVDLDSGIYTMPLNTNVSLACTALPVLGNTAMFHTSGLPVGAVGFVTLSIGPALDPGVSLAAISPPGCMQHVGPGFGSLGLILGSTAGSTPLSVPNDLTFVGVEFAVQTVALGSQITTSNGLDCVIGSF